MKNIAIYIALFAACLVVVDATTTIVATKYPAGQNPGVSNCTTKATTGELSTTYTMAAGTFCNQFSKQQVGVTPDVVTGHRKFVCNGTTTNMNMYAASDTTCSGTYTVFTMSAASWTTIHTGGCSSIGGTQEMFLGVGGTAPGTSFGENCAATTSAPTPSTPATPTPAPVASHSVTGTLSLAGVNASSLTTADQTALKEVVAEKVGSVCGVNGAGACGASDVTLTIARRDATVSYSVNVYTSAAAATGSQAISAVSTTVMTSAIQAKTTNLASASVTAVTAAATDNTGGASGLVVSPVLALALAALVIT